MKTLSQAIYAGGCFWGVEHLMQQQKGVKTVVSGYIGGTVENPTYQQVKAQGTGHAEAVMVTYDPEEISYEELTRLFFEIHDPTQDNGQGPDIGNQYRSEIFYNTPEEKVVADKLIGILKGKGYKVVTRVTPATTFYTAEDYHQDYYEHKGTEPYCHFRVRRFDPDMAELAEWIDSLKVSFIASVDEDGFPNMKAMLAPRKREKGLKYFYFTTNTSSKRVAQYRKNNKASVYFYQKGLFKYRGLMLKGTMEVCEDKATKESIWRAGDTMYYKGGIADPDYCVLKFTAVSGRYYCDFKHSNFEIE